MLKFLLVLSFACCLVRYGATQDLPTTTESTTSGSTETTTEWFTTTSTTDEPTLPPPPDNWCCNFDGSSCSWSLETINDGWVSSRSQSTSVIPSSGSDFVYILGTSGEIHSPLVLGVSPLSAFSIIYYFNADVEVAPNNRVEVFFVEATTGATTIFSSSLIMTSAWRNQEFRCIYCCGSAPTPCDGTFHVKTYNAIGHTLEVAIDGFSVDGTVCEAS